jgi:hypothetical protein
MENTGQELQAVKDLQQTTINIGTVAHNDWQQTYNCLKNIENGIAQLRVSASASVSGGGGTYSGGGGGLAGAASNLSAMDQELYALQMRDPQAAAMGKESYQKAVKAIYAKYGQTNPYAQALQQGAAAFKWWDEKYGVKLYNKPTGTGYSTGGLLGSGIHMLGDNQLPGLNGTSQSDLSNIAGYNDYITQQQAAQEWQAYVDRVNRAYMLDQQTHTTITPGGSSNTSFAEGTPNTSDESLAFKGVGGGARVTVHPNEAIIPLPDGRSVPVSIRGGGGPPINIHFNIQAKDAKSFGSGETQAQIMQLLTAQLRRAQAQIGSYSLIDDPTVRAADTQQA